MDNGAEAEITQEILSDIKKEGGFYDLAAVRQALEIQCKQDVSVFDVEDEDALKSFFENDLKAKALIPLHVNGNHIAGLHLEKSGENFRAVYFDPAGLQSYDEIPQNVKDYLKEINIKQEDVFVTKNILQTKSLLPEGDGEFYDNNHCGAFVIFVLSSIANGNILIDKNNDLRIYEYGGWQIFDLDKAQSFELGILLRQKDLELLSGQEIAQENSHVGIEFLRSVVLGRLESQFKALLKSHDQGKSAATDEQNKYLQGEKFLKDKLRDKAVGSPVIRMEGRKMRMEASRKGAGLDENFKISKAGVWSGYDKSLNLDPKGPTFAKAHVHSRISTSDYIHKDGHGGVSGHIGGLFGNLNDSKRTQKTKGSRGFHAARDSVIEEVIKDPAIPKDQKVSIATARALNHTVKSTLGYKDLKRTDISFAGFSSHGLDLSNPQEREDALKSYQASRDRRKVSAFFLQDTEEDDISGYDLDLLNESVESDGHSPIRASTPFSHAFFEDTLERFSEIDLGEDESYERIAKIYSNPTPQIRREKTPEPALTLQDPKQVSSYMRPTVASAAKASVNKRVEPKSAENVKEPKQEKRNNL